jgi:hypothetical protein
VIFQLFGGHTADFANLFKGCEEDLRRLVFENVLFFAFFSVRMFFGIFFLRLNLFGLIRLVLGRFLFVGDVVL